MDVVEDPGPDQLVRRPAEHRGDRRGDPLDDGVQVGAPDHVGGVLREQPVLVLRPGQRLLGLVLGRHVPRRAEQHDRAVGSGPLEAAMVRPDAVPLLRGPALGELHRSVGQREEPRPELGQFSRVGQLLAHRRVGVVLVGGVADQLLDRGGHVLEPEVREELDPVEDVGQRLGQFAEDCCIRGGRLSEGHLVGGEHGPPRQRVGMFQTNGRGRTEPSGRLAGGSVLFWQNRGAGDGPEPWFPSRRSPLASHRSCEPSKPRAVRATFSYEEFLRMSLTKPDGTPDFKVADLVARRVRPRRDPPRRARDARPDGDARRVRHQQAAHRRPHHRLPPHDDPDRRAHRDAGRARRRGALGVLQHLLHAGPRRRRGRRRPQRHRRTTRRACRSTPGRARRCRSTGGARSRS